MYCRAIFPRHYRLTFFLPKAFYFYRPSLSYEIVTPDFHIDRARVIAEHILALTERLEVEVNFHSVEDETVDSLKRQEHEADAKRAYLQHWSWIRDERTYLQELVTKHTNYNNVYSSNHKGPDITYGERY